MALCSMPLVRAQLLHSTRPVRWDCLDRGEDRAGHFRLQQSGLRGTRTCSAFECPLLKGSPRTAIRNCTLIRTAKTCTALQKEGLVHPKVRLQAEARPYIGQARMQLKLKEVVSKLPARHSPQVQSPQCLRRAAALSLPFSPRHARQHHSRTRHVIACAGPRQSDVATSTSSEATLSQQNGPQWQLQSLIRRVTRQLSSLPLAIGLLFAIAGACALGTLIEQGAAPAEYLRDYPSEHPVLGFLTGDVILLLGLDHVYSNPVFLSLLLLLGACLSACTSTRQLPMLKVAQRWSFLHSPSAFKSLPFSEALPSARISDVAVELRRKQYEVFQKGQSLYAFKGLAGRLAPIGVHAAMLLIMLGGTTSALGGFQGSVMLPQGQQVAVQEALRGNSPLAQRKTSMNMVLALDSFQIDYRANGEVKQYFSDLRLTDLTGRELLRKTISVNDPLRCQGVTVYQTDWSISAVQVRVDGQDPIKLPVAQLQNPEGSSVEAKLFGTFLPLPASTGESEGRRGVTILARDLQSVVLYDSEGKFVGVRRPASGKAITVDGVSIVVDDIAGSSGMQLKMDPGVPLVYAGFGALILTSFISYLSHSQVWALAEGSTVHFGGKTNRAKYQFQAELNDIVGGIPEVLQEAGPGRPSAGQAIVQEGEGASAPAAK